MCPRSLSAWVLQDGRGILAVLCRDYKEDGATWGWTRAPPASQRSAAGDEAAPQKLKSRASQQQRALKAFMCTCCRQVLLWSSARTSKTASRGCLAAPSRHMAAAVDPNLFTGAEAAPVNTLRPPLLQALPGHTHAGAVLLCWPCMSCLCQHYATRQPAAARQRLQCNVQPPAYTCAACARHSAPICHDWLPLSLTKPHMQAAEAAMQAPSGRRSLRERKAQLPCPSCKLDIAEFMATAQVNL